MRPITGLVGQIGDVQVRLAALEKGVARLAPSKELSQRLGAIPGVGLISATALAASVTDPGRLRSGRQFAAANRTARVASAIMARGGTYRVPIGMAG